MNRQLILLAVTTATVAGYLANLKQQDTLPKAADRFAKAVISSDVATLWTFVPEDERAYYNLDEEKFSHYWRTIVQPHLKGFDSYEFEIDEANGFDVIAKTTNNPLTQRTFALLVSGQKGDYYVPYIIGKSCIYAAAADISGQNVTQFQRFDHYAKWASDNRSRLLVLGFNKIRRGPMFPGESPDEMSEHFKHIADEKFARAWFPEL